MTSNRSRFHPASSDAIAPAVPERAARLRFFLTAAHSEQQIRDAVRILVEENKAVAEEPTGSGGPEPPADAQTQDGEEVPQVPLWRLTAAACIVLILLAASGAAGYFLIGAVRHPSSVAPQPSAPASGADTSSVTGSSTASSGNPAGGKPAIDAMLRKAGGRD